MSEIGDYIRSAVLIDDRVNDEYGDLERLEEPDDRVVSSEPAAGLETPLGRGETPIYWRSLVDAFLDQDIVCSVIEARRGSDVIELALRAARIADLLVMDWVFFGDDESALVAIQRIAEEYSDRLRVIVVYTGEDDLDSISSQLKGKGRFLSVPRRSAAVSKFTLHRDHTVVLMFNKPRRRSGDLDRVTGTEYTALPSSIRDELERVYDGLMPRFTFRAMNVIRDSISRVLTRFSADLDIGALVHRALLPQPEDANMQFVRLLVSEMEEALTEARMENVWQDETIREYLFNRSLIENPSDLAEILKRSTNTPSADRLLGSRDLAIEAVTRGLYSLGMKSKKVRENAHQLSKLFGKDTNSQELLATLMSSSPFGKDTPTLELGVVVEDLESESYLLCIQPLCDSVHLKPDREHAFPFLPFRDEGPDAPVAMVQITGGAVLKVHFESKPHKLVMRKFRPTSSGRVEATVSKDPHGEWEFVSGDRKYRAVARLRGDVATQAVHAFVGKASRPGLDVYELLRLGGM